MFERKWAEVERGVKEYLQEDLDLSNGQMGEAGPWFGINRNDLPPMICQLKGRSRGVL